MPKNVTLVLFAVFLLVFGTYISGTILTPYAQSLGANLFIIGVLSSSMYIVRLFIGTPLGKLADKKGTIKVLKYSLMLYPLIALAYYSSDKISELIGSRLLHGVASAMMLPMAKAYIGEISPPGKEGGYMGIYNTIILLASGLGPLAAAVIASYFGYRSTFATLFFLALISLLTVQYANRQKESGYVNYNNPNISSAPEIKINSKSLPGPRYMDFGLLGLSFIETGLAVISSFIGFFFILIPLNKGMGIITTGFILAIYNIFSGIIQFPLGKLSDKKNKFFLILCSSIVASVTLFLFPLADSAGVMILVMLIIALASAVILSSSSALSAMVGRNLGMGYTMGFLGTTNSLGMVFGSFMLGLIPQKFGINYIFYVCSTTTLVSCIIFAVLWTRSKYNCKMIDIK